MLSDKARKLGEEPAFPYAVREDTEAWSGGMVKREHFAALAMQGLIASVPTFHIIDDSENPDAKFIAAKVASFAVKQADALLEALAKEEG